MSLLEHLSEDHQQLFESLAEPVRLARGEFLLRRGESGGDVFLVKTGGLDVVDTRTIPELVLASVRPGDLLGELSFLDEAPRSADVRASSESVVLRWARDDILVLLEREPAFALSFWQALARIAARRSRSTTERVTAFRGDPSGPEVEGSTRDVRRLVETTKTALLDVEPRLRQNLRMSSMAPDPPSLEIEPLRSLEADGLPTAEVEPSPSAEVEVAIAGGSDPRGDLVAIFDGFEAEVEQLFTGATPARAAALEAVLARELTPWLVRSALGERCLRKPKRAVGTADILAHVVEDRERGEGPFGELLDRWLLDRPTLQAFRRARALLTPRLAAAIAGRTAPRVLVFNAGAGALVSEVAALLERAGEPRGELTIVDQSRTALARSEAVLAHARVGLRIVQENLVQLAAGRGRHPWAGYDAVVVHGLLEYLPDRLAISLLEVSRDAASPGGTVIAAGLAPSRDTVLLDRVLGWPTIRRTQEGIAALFQAARLAPSIEQPLDALWTVAATPLPDLGRSVATPAPRGPVRPASPGA